MTFEWSGIINSELTEGVCISDVIPSFEVCVVLANDAGIEEGFGSEDECMVNSPDTLTLEGAAVMFVKYGE